MAEATPSLGKHEDSVRQSYTTLRKTQGFYVAKNAPPLGKQGFCVRKVTPPTNILCSKGYTNLRKTQGICAAEATPLSEKTQGLCVAKATLP